jgi:hypothetical protein
LLGWAGLAMLARMSWAGWAGQVRLAGFAFILSPFCLVVVSLSFLGVPFGVPGSSLGSFVHTFWVPLSPKVQNVCKRLFPNTQGVISWDRFWHFFVFFSKKKRVRGE